MCFITYIPPAELKTKKKSLLYEVTHTPCQPFLTTHFYTETQQATEYITEKRVAEIALKCDDCNLWTTINAQILQVILFRLTQEGLRTQTKFKYKWGTTAS